MFTYERFHFLQNKAFCIDCLTFVSNHLIMRIVFFVFALYILASITSCSNSSTAKVFCDTACNTDSLHFKGGHKLNPMVDIGLSACKADSVMWTHDLAGSKLMSLNNLGQDIYLNKSAVDCYIKDTSYAWLQFNDCKTGRGYLMKLAFSKAESGRKVSGALTKFDPKFSVAEGLIAYTDRGSVFVEDMETAQKASLSFDKQYDIDFNKIHETVDSVHITKDRIFVQMIRDGQVKPYEKKISL